MDIYHAWCQHIIILVHRTPDSTWHVTPCNSASGQYIVYLDSDRLLDRIFSPESEKPAHQELGAPLASIWFNHSYRWVLNFKENDSPKIRFNNRQDIRATHSKADSTSRSVLPRLLNMAAIELFRQYITNSVNTEAFIGRLTEAISYKRSVFRYSVGPNNVFLACKVWAPTQTRGVSLQCVDGLSKSSKNKALLYPSRTITPLMFFWARSVHIPKKKQSLCIPTMMWCQ